MDLGVGGGVKLILAMSVFWHHFLQPPFPKMRKAWFQSSLQDMLPDRLCLTMCWNQLYKLLSRSSKTSVDREFPNVKGGILEVFPQSDIIPCSSIGLNFKTMYWNNLHKPLSWSGHPWNKPVKESIDCLNKSMPNFRKKHALVLCWMFILQNRESSGWMYLFCLLSTW